MKKHKSTIIFGVIFVIGLSVLAYPYVSNLYNKKIASYAIADYDNIISESKEESINEIFNKAEEYNKSLLRKQISYELSKEENDEYFSQLTLPGSSDMMGYVLIDKINLKLPIYHGTSASVLQVGSGHLEWTSLPIGGIGNHSVLTGHRGLPTAKLFTNLDKLEVGDMVVVKILNREIYYVVRETKIVEPTEVNSLKPVEGEDLLTLVTCTPYGVNSHRLLVKCVRTDKNHEDLGMITNDGVVVNPYLIALIIAIILLFVSKVVNKLYKRRKNNE